MGLYDGMTANERLFMAGLMDAWDQATKARDRGEMAVILSRVELAEDAPAIIDTVLANPAKYGL